MNFFTLYIAYDLLIGIIFCLFILWYRGLKEGLQLITFFVILVGIVIAAYHVLKAVVQ